MSEPNNPGWALYRGLSVPPAAAVDFGSIDYSAPIGWAAPEAGELVSDPGIAWPPSTRWPVAVRQCLADGAEIADPDLLLCIETDSTGQLADPRPAAPLLLSAKPVSSRRIEASWLYPPDDPPDRFEIFIAPKLAGTLDDLLAAAPAGMVQPNGAGRYRWSSPALELGRSYRLAVRPVSLPGTTGPAAETFCSPAPESANSISFLTAEVR